MMLIAFALMTTSCSDADYKLTHYFQMIKNRKTVFHEDTPLYKSLEKFSYPLTNKRNPFIYGAEKIEKVTKTLQTKF